MAGNEDRNWHFGEGLEKVASWELAEGIVVTILKNQCGIKFGHLRVDGETRRFTRLDL